MDALRRSVKGRESPVAKGKSRAAKAKAKAPRGRGKSTGKNARRKAA
jgi:hypothetical protein